MFGPVERGKANDSPVVAELEPRGGRLLMFWSDLRCPHEVSRSGFAAGYSGV